MPGFTSAQTIDQNFILEPIGGPKEPQTYIDHFPSEVYNKNLDSHLVKFLYALLGPTGVGRLRRQYTEARLLYEAHHLELFDLDKFYGNPFKFGRVADEQYTEDVRSLLTQDQWEAIRAKDSKYRNRIIDFLTGARAGNTPQGMRLVARSGVGHEVEIIENYRALFDANTDDPLGIPRVGNTRLLGEMIILPRQEISRSELQTIDIVGSPTGGNFTLSTLNPARTSSLLPYNASRQQIQAALVNLFLVSSDSIAVNGAQGSFTVRFTGSLEGRNIDQLRSSNTFTGPTGVGVKIGTRVQGFDGSQEIVDVAPINQKHLQEAIDRIRPVTVIPTIAKAAGTKSRIDWVRAGATSEFDELIRYVTGSGGVLWPPVDSVHWIESGIEHQSLRAHNELGYQYSLFHDPTSIVSYDESAVVRPDYLTSEWASVRKQLSSLHLGEFDPHHSLLYYFLRNSNSSLVFSPDKALHLGADEMIIDRVVETPNGPVSLINGIYPDDYFRLPNVKSQKTSGPMYFWASLERSAGTEYLEIDFGSPKAINYLAFEITQKPVDIDIHYDLLDQGPERAWAPARFSSTLPSSTSVTANPAALNPWFNAEYYVSNGKNEIIYSRYIRLKFTRRATPGFLEFGGVKYPWSVDVRNLKVGRVVANQ